MIIKSIISSLSLTMLCNCNRARHSQEHYDWQSKFQEHLTSNKSRMVQIVRVMPDATHGVILTAVFTLTKLYHATQSATHAL
jgi:hypothetical protein